APQFGHLLDRGRHVRGVGIGHGLDDHRGTAADRHAADVDLAGGTARPGSDGSRRRGLGDGIVLHVRILVARGRTWPNRRIPAGGRRGLATDRGILVAPGPRAQDTAMLKPSYPLNVANAAETPNADLEVRDKYNGQVATRVAMADADAVERAIAAAVRAAPAMAALPAWRRQAVLEHCVARFRERAEELAMALCIEAGKPIRDARGEVTRLIDTFRIAAEEAVRIEGQTVNLEISERGTGYRGVWKRVPIGPCSFITPFNFPLNLVAHKVAPAIAAGCPFVLKPAGKTPVGALIIAEILAETDLPEGAFSVFSCDNEVAAPLIEDDRIRLLSFTGGLVGWEFKARAGRKKVTLELGGNAACIVDGDQAGRLDHVVERLAFGAYYQSGQSCIGVQRILAHASVYDALKERLVAKIGTFVAGDPKDEATFIGPMIDEAAAQRLE